jgi:4-amino-4-deoxy-L-arabinose transferase-like glycosyltransferase
MPARQADPMANCFPTAPCHPWLTAAAVPLLLAIYWLLTTSALAGKSNTCDEIIHLTGGSCYWLRNDYRLQPENGNLPQRWHALANVWNGNCRLPSLENPAWKRSDAWKVGEAMFFDSGIDPAWQLARGRAMAALLGVGVCLTAFLWSWRLFGIRGGLVSLVLSAFCPALLAHGSLMTSDACLTLFLLLSVWAIWELLHEITPLRLAGGMLAIAGLFLSKMSAPLILPMAGLMVLARLWWRQPLTIRCGNRRWTLALRRQQLAAAVAMTMLCGLFAYTAVWAAYGFRYSAFAEGPLTDAKLYKLDSVEKACSAIPGRAGRVIAWMADKQVLPEAYLYGTAFVLAHLKRVAFLNGEYAISGWRHYFPYCFAVKTPLALFGLLLLSAIGWVRQPAASDSCASSPTRPRWYDLIPLAVLLGVFGASAIQSTFNIGYRHILPVYPALYIVCGAAANWFGTAQRTARISVVGMLALFVADSLAAYPNYIAYFNPLVPRTAAYRHLVDSNLDWGQDLPGLAQWLRQHNAGDAKLPVYLAYFGNGRPTYYGIEAVNLPPAEDIRHELPLRAGLYCISATRLQAVYESAGGRWNRAYEEKYQARRRQIDSCPAAERARARSCYEYAKYLRLLAYLRHRPADANVGYSILIFRLNADEIEAALNGPPAELDDKPWLPGSLKHL